MALACGNVHQAAALGGAGWQRLAEGDQLGALRMARAGEKQRTAASRLLEAEALIASGAIMAGLARLEQLHAASDSAATVALARRLHMLADYAGAEQVAHTLPMHSTAALVGARAALAGDRVEGAFRFVEPYLYGPAPIPSPATASALALIASSVLARNRQFEALETFAEGLLHAPDLPEDMMPGVARVAWMAGLGADAWEKFAGETGWRAAACLELAILSGNEALAARAAQRAGVLAAPSEPALRLLRGDFFVEENAPKIFREGAVVHIWRTHPCRWQPWIEAALATPAEVGVFDLTRGIVPDSQAVPQAVFDDASLAEVLAPRPVVPTVRGSAGVRVEPHLVKSTGIGHEWPESELAELRKLTSCSASIDGEAVRIAGEETALHVASRGLPVVLIAAPGDPFWAGPLPERVWPSMRIIRMDGRHGWSGAAARAAEAARELGGMA